jgi:hypothetical protein
MLARFGQKSRTGQPDGDNTVSLLPPAGPQAQGWTEKCKSGPCQCWAEAGGSPSRHRPGQVLADLAPRAKVVQTVGCSTFTRRAKPATRRVADGERMNPQGKGGAFAPIPRRRRAPGRRPPGEPSTRGLAPPYPPCMAPVAPLFHPLPSYADAAGSSLHQRGEPRTFVIVVQLACN